MHTLLRYCLISLCALGLLYGFAPDGVVFYQPVLFLALSLRVLAWQRARQAPPATRGERPEGRDASLPSAPVTAANAGLFTAPEAPQARPARVA